MSRCRCVHCVRAAVKRGVPPAFHNEEFSYPHVTTFCQYPAFWWWTMKQRPVSASDNQWQNFVRTPTLIIEHSPRHLDKCHLVAAYTKGTLAACRTGTRAACRADRHRIGDSQCDSPCADARYPVTAVPGQCADGAAVLTTDMLALGDRYVPAGSHARAHWASRSSIIVWLNIWCRLK